MTTTIKWQCKLKVTDIHTFTPHKNTIITNAGSCGFAYEPRC